MSRSAACWSPEAPSVGAAETWRSAVRVKRFGGMHVEMNMLCRCRDELVFCCNSPFVLRSVCVCSSSGVTRRSDRSLFCAELRKVNTVNVKRSHVRKVIEMKRKKIYIYLYREREFALKRVSALCDVMKDTHASPSSTLPTWYWFNRLRWCFKLPSEGE